MKVKSLKYVKKVSIWRSSILPLYQILAKGDNINSRIKKLFQGTVEKN